MGGGEEPAGLNGATRPAPGTLSACPFVPCFALNQSLCSCWFLANTKEVRLASLVGAGRPKARPIFFLIFFVKFSNARLSNFKHGLVEIQNMVMQVEKKLIQGKI